MLKSRAFLGICMLLFMTACSGSHNGVLPSNGANGDGRSYGIAVPNHFAELRGKQITDDQIDQYIAASVSGEDRKLAHRLMAAMPADLRGDFISIDESGHVVSNNPNLVQFVKTTHVAPGWASKPGTLAPPQRVRDTAAIRPMDGYVSQCAPPNSNTGAFIRDVAACGMTDGWGFVNVPCNSTYMASGDQGNLYMEIVGSGGASSGSLIEGGFQYNYHGGGYADTIQAYARTSYSVNGGGGGYEQMNYSNPGYEFGCGQNLTITHGISMAANDWVYTMVGQLPSSIDPQTQYVNMNSQFFYPDNYVWLWTPPGPDVTGVGTDLAGYTTPCAQCTVAKVTSIAQSGGYHNDGSYFGVSGGFDVINWMEVIFGEYSSNCTGQTGGTCQIESTSDPTVYFAGAQEYPNAYVSETHPGPTGWGPYESYDGIELDGVQRQVRGTFTEPLPPPPCTIDSYGYCSNYTSQNTLAYCYTQVWSTKIQDYVYHRNPYYQNRLYAIFRGGKQVELATQTTTKDPSMDGNCAVISVTWSPSEPKTTFGDPNLP